MIGAHSVDKITGKVTLVHKESGEKIMRWPVDAKEIIAQGEFELVEPTPEPTSKKAAKVEEETEEKIDANIEDVVQASGEKIPEFDYEVPESAPKG